MTVQPPTQPDQRKKKSPAVWIALGCGGVMLFGAMCVLFILMIFNGVMSGIKSSEPYQQSVKLLESNPDVKAEIGAVKSLGWFVPGSIEVSGSTGKADLSIPVEGEKGSGRLEVELEKHAGQWSFTRAEFVCGKSGDRIDMLRSPAKKVREDEG